jgi:hypothetical protein
MRKSITACVMLTAALVLALSTGAWADVTPGQDIGQQATSQQSASSTATSTQTNPSNTAVSVNILSPGATSGNVTQSNSSSATSSAGNTNGTTQTAGQQAGCCDGGSGVQGIGQSAGSGQQATSSATSTQTNPSNTAVSVNILSPGATSGNVTQSNDSSATSSAGNTNGTTQTAGQQAGCCDGGSGVQAIGQQAANYQQAASQAVSTQVDPSNHAISVSILSPGAGGGNVSQSNGSSATSSAGNTNGTTQAAQQQAGCGICTATVPVACPGGCPSHPLGPIQAIGQLATNQQQAGSAATSTQTGATNVAGALDLGLKPHDDVHSILPISGNVTQSNSSSATSAAGNTNGTTQSAQQQGGAGAVQGIGQAAYNAQQAMSAATSTQWCPANLVFGSFGNVWQSNASAALSSAGNTNGTSQYGTQA